MLKIAMYCQQHNSTGTDLESLIAVVTDINAIVVKRVNRIPTFPLTAKLCNLEYTYFNIC